MIAHLWYFNSDEKIDISEYGLEGRDLEFIKEIIDGPLSREEGRYPYRGRGSIFKVLKISMYILSYRPRKVLFVRIDFQQNHWNRCRQIRLLPTWQPRYWTTGEGKNQQTDLVLRRISGLLQVRPRSGENEACRLGLRGLRWDLDTVTVLWYCNVFKESPWRELPSRKIQFTTLR